MIDGRTVDSVDARHYQSDMRDTNRLGWSRGFFGHLREHATDAVAPAQPTSFARPDGRAEVVAAARALLSADGSDRVRLALDALRTVLPEDPATLDKLALIAVGGAAKDLATAYRMEGGRRADEDAAARVYDRAMFESKFH